MMRGMKWFLIPALTVLFASAVLAEVPANLVADGVPEHPAALRAEVGRYLQSRSASFQGWHPTRREILIVTRFAETPQAHVVKMPGGARTQITFGDEPVSGAEYQPGEGKSLVFVQDTGGSEFFQLYRLDVADGKVTLLTDGKSRNSAPHWSPDGKLIAYTSTQRTGSCSDVHVMNPQDPKSDRLAAKIDAPGWGLVDWSPDGTRLLVQQEVSINESYLHLVDVKSGEVTALTKAGKEKVAYGDGVFAADGKSLFVTSDRDSEFLRLVRFDLATGKETPLAPEIPWDIEHLKLSPDGKTLAFVANEDGFSILRLLDTATGKVSDVPSVPKGVMAGLDFHANNRDLGFTLASARSAADVYSLDVTTGKVDRWTESEIGGLNPATFAEPELLKFKSFDGLEFSAFIYHADAAKFPGPRPTLIEIHGGPESQSRPIFMGRMNYLINELGITLIVPNVRGSAGRGKSFLLADNGFKREDSVRDIGALIDWIKATPGFDPQRIAVEGGSYGGYMVLASLTHFSDKLRCGTDIVGISNFVSFLTNTQGYRRDLRRVEYGDERDPAMHDFLEKISPLNQVDKITRPLFVVQGANDPRVPMSESEQMVKAMRSAGRTAWYLMAKDEGHGFHKKRNIDFQFASTVLFWKEHLLGDKK